MQLKSKLRKRYFNLRKKKYYDIDKNFFLPLIKLTQFEIKKKIIKIALYYPSNFELNILKILEFARSFLELLIKSDHYPI